MAMGGMERSDSLLGGRYRIIRELGRGGFGYTYLAEDINRFNELCVLKEFFPQVTGDAALHKAKQLFEREAGVLYQLNHPQIPRFRELLRVQSGHDGSLFLVQDYVEGPTYEELLATRLQSGQRFSEPEVTQLLKQILPVLEYLHGVGVIHRDISPDNLILRNADGLPVLIDFGGVKQLVTVVEQQVGAETVTTRLGKVGYAPEEQLASGKVTPSADLYALAVTALVLLTGEQPQVLYDSYNKQWQWQGYTTLSPRFSQVLGRMLAPRLGDRYASASAVIHALSTPSTYAAPTPPSQRYDPTVAVAPGMGNLPPSTIAMPPRPAQQPVKRSPKRSDKTANGCFQAFFGLLLLVGSVGLVWWVSSQWNPNSSVPLTDNNGVENGDSEDNTAASFSPEEQARKNALKQRRDALQVNESFLVRLTDQFFFNQFPDLQGNSLSDRPEDAPMRAEWDSIANEILDVLETHLSGAARSRLGAYTAADRDQWREQVNQKFVSSRALYDLTDAKFAYLFPQNAAQNFIDQPVGQIWHGIASDRVQAIVSGDRLETVQFSEGEFGQSLRDRLEPGEGRVYIMNLAQGQLLRLNLQAPSQGARLSLYVPSPTDAVPFLLEDSTERVWSGELPQSGYYEIVVVSTQGNSLDYGLDVGADTVTSSPNEPEATPEDKD